MKDQNVCCCIYHVELEELRVGFNHMLQKLGLHLSSHCDCNCEAICQSIDGLIDGCMGSHATFPSLITMWESIICPKDRYVVWHA